MSSIDNSSVDELQVLANLETYRRAMLLSMHLHSELVNRKVKAHDLLSSLYAEEGETSDQQRLSPTAFIHLLIYVLRADQLPAYMQPHFALAPNARPFPVSIETDIIIESLHDLVEAVVSFQSLRRTGIETFYKPATVPRTDAEAAMPLVLRLNADFEVALKVTVLRQQNMHMR